MNEDKFRHPAPWILLLGPAQQWTDLTEWCNNRRKGLRLKKRQGHALVTSDDGQHHWIPRRHVQERKEEAMVWRRSSWRAASDGDNETDDRQPPRTGSKEQQSQTAHLGSTGETDHWRGKIDQRTGTAFDLSYVVLAYVVCGNYRGWCQSYLLGICAQSSPIKTNYMGGFFCSSFDKWLFLVSWTFWPEPSFKTRRGPTTFKC